MTAGDAAASRVSDRALVVMLAAITAAGPVALNIYLPALPEVQAHFATSVARMNTTVSAALIAFAAGMLVFGPVSDRYGRRPVILAGQCVFALGSVLCLVAPSLEALLLGRVVQALGTAAGLVVARAMLGDLYGRERMAGMIALLTMVMVVGPTTAPLVGGILTETFGWKSVFAALLAANLATIAVAWRYLPETRARDLATNSPRELARASWSMVRQPAFLGFTIQAGVIYATFLTFISIAPYVMVNLGHSSTEYGMWYLLVSIGYFLGNWTVTRVVKRIGLHRLIMLGLSVQLGSAMLGAAIALAGWWHPAAIFVPMGLLGIGQGLALPNISASAIALAPHVAGSASSMLGFSQQMIGAIAVQSMAGFATDSPVPIYVFTVAAALFAWISLFVLPRSPEAADPARA